MLLVKGEGIIKSGGVDKKAELGDAIFISPNETHQFWIFKKSLSALSVLYQRDVKIIQRIEK